MKMVKLSASVCGASHKSGNLPCQDAHSIEQVEDIVIVAVADGHGSVRCKFSDRGAKFAVEAFGSVVKAYAQKTGKDREQFIRLLRQENAGFLVKDIRKIWKGKIQKSYDQLKSKDEELCDVKEVDAELYGTTLLGLVLAPEFIFAVQIGDGDIMYVNDSGVERIVDSPRFLGTATYSLSNEEPWRYVGTYFQRMHYMENAPCMFMLSTDGFANSFLNEEQFQISCKEYFETICNYGDTAVQNKLKDWLSQTSEEGCGDDITFVAVGAV